MSDEFCIAETEFGQVRGVKIISEVDIPYWRFLGIPYAKPPVGELRFKEPLKASPWNGVLDALVEPTPCAAINGYTKKFEGTDDCLYLNVYTKDIQPGKLRPVFVYIHGGAFNFGSSSLFAFSPDYLLMHNIVIAIFNYRVGPLGFLSLKDKTLNVPGNAGQKDQRMALEFVRDNIKYFGGDPNNVTLAGHSSGAVSVGLHCLSENSRGLFHKAIILGGSPTYSVGPDLNWAKRLAVKLGFDENIDDENIDDEKEILKFLNNVDVLKMAEAASKVADPQDYMKHGFFMPFSPTLEPYLSDSTFLSKNPVDLFEGAWSKDIDIMIGGVEDEGMYLEVFLKGKGANAEIILPAELREKILKIQEYYNQKFDSKRAREKLLGDAFIWLGIFKFIKSRLNSGEGKTFVEKFAVDSPTQNHYRNRHCGPGLKGVSHGDELSYTWKNGLGDVPPRDSMEFRSIEKFTSLLASFMEKENSGIPDWQPVNDLPPKVLTIFPDESKFDTPEEFKRIQEFWEKLYEEVGVKLC